MSTSWVESPEHAGQSADRARCLPSVDQSRGTARSSLRSAETSMSAALSEAQGLVRASGRSQAQDV
jgi:hypothetical protein